MRWKRHLFIVVSFFFSWFLPDCTQQICFLFIFAYSYMELADRWFLNVWSKSGRPVSLAIVFADCGSLVGVFLSFLKIKNLVHWNVFRFFMDKCAFFHWFGHSLIRWPLCVGISISHWLYVQLVLLALTSSNNSELYRLSIKYLAIENSLDGIIF